MQNFICFLPLCILLLKFNLSRPFVETYFSIIFPKLADKSSSSRQPGILHTNGGLSSINFTFQSKVNGKKVNYRLTPIMFHTYMGGGEVMCHISRKGGYVHITSRNFKIKLRIFSLKIANFPV